jgi:hypothetical protein
MGYPTVLPVTGLVCFTSPSSEFLHHSDFRNPARVPPTPKLQRSSFACSDMPRHNGSPPLLRPTLDPQLSDESSAPPGATRTSDLELQDRPLGRTLQPDGMHGVQWA